MNTYPQQQITLGILAGGQSRRMKGQDKGLRILSGKPLIEHVLARLQPQTGHALINANRNIEHYRHYQLPIISDTEKNFSGPLAGIVALLEQCTTPWLLVAPCDTPNLPKDLAARLYHQACSANAEIVVATTKGQRHPVVALIKRELAAPLGTCLANGEHKIIDCFKQRRLVYAPFDDQTEAFANLNTAHDWAYHQGSLLGTKAKSLNSTLDCPTPLLGIAAWSGVGKTQLLTSLLPRLKQAGLQVAVIKHAHHDFDPDLPGKDSYELRRAGAQQMLIASNQRWALICEEPVKDRPDLQHLLDQLDHSALDLVLVEGFKKVPMAKLELFRPEVGKPLRYPEDPSIIAIACPDTTSLSRAPDRLDLNQVEELTQFLIGYQKQARKDLL